MVSQKMRLSIAEFSKGDDFSCQIEGGKIDICAGNMSFLNIL